LTPEYEGAAAVLAAQEDPRTIAKVDATENKGLADRMEIKGFPTLYFFNQGAKQEYTGGRTKDTIIEWVNKKTGPVSKEVDCAGMTTAVSENALALSFFGALEGEMYDAYIKAAKNPTISEKYAFFHTTDADCASGFGSPSTGLSLSRRFDESPLAYSGAASEEEIVAWAKTASVPTLITFSEDYIEPIFGDRNAALVLFTEETGTGYQGVFE